jgi:rare lipoprotein A
MTAAHRTIPRGTIVTVTNLANGRSVQVRINDRGPYVDGRIIDLNREAFAAIASVSKGVARVRIEW